MQPDFYKPRQDVESQVEVALTLDTLGLDPETLVFLKNRVVLPNNPNFIAVEAIVKHYARFFYPREPDLRNIWGWLLSKLGHDSSNLSYLVTTPEGAKFTEAYQYLHTLRGLLYAHAPKGMGNVFMLRGGERYIKQFPNAFHLAFIRSILTAPLAEEEGVRLFGGYLESSYVYYANKYLNDLVDVAKTLQPSSIAISHLASTVGVSLPGSWFLEDISPEGVRDREPKLPIAKIYRRNVPQVKKTLLEAGMQLANPSFVIESLLGGYFAYPQNLFFFEFFHAVQLIEILKEVTGESYPLYQAMLQQRVRELEAANNTIPHQVVEALK